MPFHLCNTKSKTKPFQVVLISRNGNVLSDTMLGSREAAIINIAAQGKETNGTPYWQDDTGDKPRVFVCIGGIRHIEIPRKPWPKYIPGINPKKKK